ncbi:MAG: hypothetical protein ACRDIV_19905, partial [Ktedonobacteraceae bacterium]
HPRTPTRGVPTLQGYPVPPVIPDGKGGATPNVGTPLVGVRGWRPGAFGRRRPGLGWVGVSIERSLTSPRGHSGGLRRIFQSPAE